MKVDDSNYINLKDLDGDSIDVELHDEYIEIMIDSSTGCAPIEKEEAIKLARIIHKRYGILND